MKIALIGYGKMGREIERIARDRGHEIVATIDMNEEEKFHSDEFKSADVAIEFTSPASAFQNYIHAFEAGVPVVSGTTGWLDRIDQIKEACEKEGKTFFYASNFSLGVNLFFALNNYLAGLMNRFNDYNVRIEEIHHIHKLDAPSGTAITIAEGIIENNDSKTSWVNELVGSTEELIPKKDELLIESLRIEEVPGTHTVLYSSEVDQIEFKHTAHNRDGFALGAVVAAEWLKGKKGFYQVTDIFDFN